MSLILLLYSREHLHEQIKIQFPQKVHPCPSDTDLLERECFHVRTFLLDKHWGQNKEFDFQGGGNFLENWTFRADLPIDVTGDRIRPSGHPAPILVLPLAENPTSEIGLGEAAFLHQHAQAPAEFYHPWIAHGFSGGGPGSILHGNFLLTSTHGLISGGQRVRVKGQLMATQPDVNAAREAMVEETIRAIKKATEEGELTPKDTVLELIQCAGVDDVPGARAREFLRRQYQLQVKIHR